MPILKTEAELTQELEQAFEGNDVDIDSSNAVNDVPKAFTDWVTDNAERIQHAKSKPYFIRDNSKTVNSILNPESTPEPESTVLPKNATDLIEHMKKFGDLGSHYDGAMSENEIYRKWDSLTDEQRIKVIERGRFSGMIASDDTLDFANLYRETSRTEMVGVLQDELSNLRDGYDVEDTNHYILKFKGNDAIIYSTDLTKPLTAAQLKKLEFVSANNGLSNYRYWVADDAAKQRLMREMEFVEYVDGKVTSESLLYNQISELMMKAQRAGAEIQSIAEKIANQNNAKVTPINYKSRESIMRKILSKRQNPETPDFMPSELKDAVRNTIIAPRQSINAIINVLKSTNIFLLYKQQKTELGYVGNIINVRASQGVIGEIQVNTPAMIYAKEKPEIARSIIGDDMWEKIHRQTNVDGGLGHKYYEEWRVMTVEEKQSERGQQLLRKSMGYYAIFAKL